MRQLVARDQDISKEPILNRRPSESDVRTAGIPVPGGGRKHIVLSGSESPRKRVPDSPQNSSATSPVPVAKSWGDVATRIPLSFAPAHVRTPTFSQVVSAKPVVANKHLVLRDFPTESQKGQ